MRKLLTLILAIAFTLSLASCKRDWTCTCKSPNGTTRSIQLDGLSEKKAKEGCELSEGISENCSLN